MIVKNFELKKKNLKQHKFFLFYGNNQGLIQDIIQNIIKPVLTKNIYKYEESEILKDMDNFKNQFLPIKRKCF